MEKPDLQPYLKDSVAIYRRPSFSPAALHQVLNHLSVAVMLTDAQANLIYCNNAFCKLFSIQHHADTIYGVNWTQFANKMYATFLLSKDFTINVEQIINDKNTTAQRLKLYDERYLAVEYSPCFTHEGYEVHQFILTM